MMFSPAWDLHSELLVSVCSSIHTSVIMSAVNSWSHLSRVGVVSLMYWVSVKGAVYYAGWSEMCHIYIGDSLNPRKAIVQILYCTPSFPMTWIRPLNDLGMKLHSPKPAWVGWVTLKGTEEGRSIW